MKKPQGYDQAQAITGDYQTLPPGGYICRIKKAVEQTTRNGKQMLVLLVDVVDEDYAGYFQKIFDANTSKDKKWPNGGIYRQLTEGKSMDFFKGMVTCIEKSNPGYIGFVNDVLDEKQLSGKLIGCVFGREQYEKDNGDLAFATKIVQVRSVEAIKAGVEPPADKLLVPQQTSSNTGFGLGTEVVFDDEDVPF